ncbi:unnamed protein product [Trichogramma brassicae]|uniref:Protein Wnt n=1 Tax=Trichogramma brassicae TaxID=86971 RepID=A0A6H5I8E0_9HYME|nr:unnamed protein product [Trichogramma brassicae]
MVASAATTSLSLSTSSSSSSSSSSSPSVVVGAALCARIPGLGKAQRELCKRSPHAMPAVGEGAEMGLKECRHQFRNHRWNCSDVVDDQIFGHVVVVGSREAAFTYAIASAGVTYAVTAACSRGNITACGCESSLRTRKEVPPNGWEWGGCSADISYGMRFARRFLDAREIEGDARSLMNLHNNKAGRKIVKSLLQTECKCHGVSGSCTVRTCWRTLPTFRQIGDALMKKYYRARPVIAITPPAAPSQSSSSSTSSESMQLRSSSVPSTRPILVNDAKSQGAIEALLQADDEDAPLSGLLALDHGWPVKRSGSIVVHAPVKQQQQQQQPRQPHLVLKRAKFDSTSPASSISQKRIPKRSELVFLQPSPNYCEPDLEQGSLGTQGRYCNRTSRVYAHVAMYCKFQWCCKVHCETCTERTEEYTCK